MINPSAPHDSGVEANSEFHQNPQQPPAYSALYQPPAPGASPQPLGPAGTPWPGGVGGLATHQHQQQYLSSDQPLRQTNNQQDLGDVESDQNWESNLSGFSEKSVRLAFIRKVFAILAVMLVVTGAMMCIFMFVDDIKEYAAGHIWVYLSAIAVYIGAVIALICSGDMRRKVPQNFIFLAIITVAMGVMLGCIAATYDAKEVLMAVGITLLITLGMMALGFQNKVDFTHMTGILVVLTFSLIGFGLMCAIFRSEILYIFYACLGAGIFSLWIVVDVQMMLGGKHKFSISPEEYIVAALNLYLDIVNIFLYVLMIIGMIKN